MAENIDRILQQLKQLQVEAGGAEQRLERLYKMLSNIVQLSARGGIPTETGVGRVTGRLLTGEQQVAGRPRVGGGAYARLSAVAGSVQTIIDEIINTQSKLAERELAAIKASSLRQTRFGAIPKTRLPTTLATPIEEQAPGYTPELAFGGVPTGIATTVRAQLLESVQKEVIRLKETLSAEVEPGETGLSTEAKKQLEELIKFYQNTANNIMKQINERVEQTLSATTPSTREFAPTVPTSAQMYADTEIEKLLAGMSKTEKMGISPVEISRMREKYEDAYNAIYGAQQKVKQGAEELDKSLKLVAQRLGGEEYAGAATKAANATGHLYDTITTTPLRAVNDEFKTFTISLNNSAGSMEKVNIYVRETAKGLEFLSKQQFLAARTVQQAPVTTEGLARSLDPFRAKRALEFAERAGFGVEQLTGVTTELPVGISRLKFEAKDAEGVMQRLNLVVDRYGKVLVQTNRRLIPFTEAIIKNAIEVTKWGAGVALVYGGMYRLQQLVRVAIDNETKLADVAIILGDAHRDLNEIFDDAAEVAKETGENINAVLETYVLAYRAVGAVEDPIRRTAAANKLLTDSTILNKLSTLDAASSIDVLAGSIRQMQQPQETMEQALERSRDLLDKWITVNRKANVDLATLATAFSITSESALNAGVSVEQLNAIIAALAEKIGGLGGRETGNAVRALIGGVYQQQASDILSRYGIAVQDTTGKMRPFLDISKEIFDLYSAKLISSDELNKIGYVLGGGVRRGQQYVAFLSDFERIQELVAVQTDATGAAQAALGRKLDTTQVSVTQLGNAFQSLAQTLGTKGGILDLMNGVIKAATLLLGLFDKMGDILGSLTVPTTVLALAGLIFSGQTGARRLDAFKYNLANVSQRFGGGIENLLLRTPGFAMQQRVAETFGQTGRAGAIGTRAGFAFQKYAPALALGSFQGLSRLSQGQTKEAGIDFAGAILGAFATGGSPIGALIGSAIADTFVATALAHEPEFENLFKNMFKAGLEGVEEEIEPDEFQATMEEIFGEGLGGAGTIGRIRARLDQVILNTFGGLAEDVGGWFGRDFDLPTVTMEQAALRNATPEQLERLGKLRTETPAQVTEDVLGRSAIEQRRLALASKEIGGRLIGDIIDEIITSSKEALRQKAFKGEIRPKQLLTGLEETQGFKGTLPKLYEAFGEQFDLIDDSISGAEETLVSFSEILIKASEEDRLYLIQLASEIFEINAGLEDAKTLGRDSFEWTGGITKVTDGAALLADKLELASNAARVLSEELRLSEVTLPQVVSLEVEQGDLAKVVARAGEYEDIFKAALTPDERLKYEREQELANILVETWINANQIAYERLQGGPGTQFLTQAFKDMVQSGEISRAITEGLGYQFVDFTQAQLQAIMPQYQAVRQSILAQGGVSEEDPLLTFFKDSASPVYMQKDWKIVQYLLQQILDVEKKQLDGIYNLPEGASFFVPAQTLQYAYNAGFNAAAGGGGGGFGGGGLTDELARPPGPYTRTPSQPIPGQMDIERIREAWLQLKDKEWLRERTRTFIPEIGEPTALDTDEGKKLFLERGGKPAILPKEGEGGVIELITSIDSLGTSFASSLDAAIQRLINFFAGRGPESMGLKGETLDLESIQTLSDTNIGKPAPANLDLNFRATDNIQLLIDGRLLAAIVKQYIFEDLIRFEGTGGSATRVTVI